MPSINFTNSIKQIKNSPHPTAILLGNGMSWATLMNNILNEIGKGQLSSK